jgi:carbon monoxide dehydrogenase subunit G
MKHTLLAAVAIAAGAVANAAPGRDETTVDLADGSIRQPYAAAAASSSPNEVHVERHGSQFLVHARSEVDADTTTIWTTLSDYDHLAQFIPNMSSSRTISRNGAEAVVEQKGVMSFGSIRRSFTVRFEVREQPHESISLSGAGDDLELFDARYDIVPLTPYRSTIVYEATIVSRLPVPSFLGLAAVRSTISSQFGALIQEVLRRRTT